MNNQKFEPLKSYQEVIVAEFNYIAQTAFQANEDRARVSQFYFIFLGTLLAAILSVQFELEDIEVLYSVFALLFVAVAFVGALTILQLTKLRLAWYESVLAMNHIKQQLIEEYPVFEETFLWKKSTVPSKFKRWSIGFLMALQVALISGGALGAASAFYWLSLSRFDLPWAWILVTIIFSTLLFISLFYYFPLIRDRQ